MLGVLLLRGAQTPGELKQRTERMQGFADLDAVQEVLDRLVERELVLRLARRPGQKEERYVHQLSAEAEDAPAVEQAPEPLVARTAPAAARRRPPRPARGGAGGAARAGRGAAPRAGPLAVAADEHREVAVCPGDRRRSPAAASQRNWSAALLGLS